MRTEDPSFVSTLVTVALLCTSADVIIGKDVIIVEIAANLANMGDVSPSQPDQAKVAQQLFVKAAASDRADAGSGAYLRHANAYHCRLGCTVC